MEVSLCSRAFKLPSGGYFETSCVRVSSVLARDMGGEVENPLMVPSIVPWGHWSSFREGWVSHTPDSLCEARK